MINQPIAHSCLFAIAATMLAIGSSAQAAETGEPKELFEDLLHSDVALWGTGEKVWPRGFVDGDSFGCSSRVQLGDWRLDREGRDSEWWRLQNYGVFHCAIIERRAGERAELKDADHRYSFAIELGREKVAGKPMELWALQSGTRPGSDYTLLMREPGGKINSFALLQQKCPARQTRKGPDLDVWSTSYCSIGSQSQLIALARKMSHLPPIGSIKRQGDVPEDSD